MTGIVTALGVGLMVGVVRERHTPAPVAGVRTHALTALLGAVAMELGPLAYGVAFAIVGVLVAIAYWRHDADDLGLTGEVALLATFVLAGLAHSQPWWAAALGVVVAALLMGKAQLHHLVRQWITERELQDALLLAAAAVVVMPLLPAHAVDPWGVLVPRTIWKVVVLVMAVGMAGHLALRAVGARWGLALAGFFAGFASSTAAVAGFGQRAKAEPALLAPSAAAAVLANLASLLLLIVVLWTIAPDLVLSVAWPLLAAVTVLGAAAALNLHDAPTHAPPEAPAAQAFKLSHALVIAAIIAGVSLLSAWLRQSFGDGAAVAAAVLVALTEVHVAAVSLAQLHTSGGLSAAHAQWGIVAILAASAAAKSVLAFVSGGARYGLRVGAVLVTMVLAAAAVLSWQQGQRLLSF